MVKTIADFIPLAEDLLALEVEELAGVLLEYFHNVGRPVEQHGRISPGNFFDQFNDNNRSVTLPPDYKAHRGEVINALQEAWCWLESEGFLVKDPTQPSSPQFSISRRGQRLKSRESFEAAYREANALPKRQLHP